MRHFRLKLATRIYSGFGVALLFAVGIAAFGAVGLLSIESRVDTMSTLADGNARALQITNDLEVMRRAALRFKLDGAEEAVREGAEASSRIRGMIQSVAAASGSRERREIYENAALSLDEFQKQREALIGFGRSLAEERAKLDAGGIDLMKALARTSAAAGANPDAALALAELEKSIQTVRLEIWQFIATRDAKAGQRFRTAIQNAYEALAVMEQTDLPADVLAVLGPVNATLAVFAASFEHLASTFTKSDELFNDVLVPGIDAIQQALRDAQHSLEREFQAARAASDATVSTTVTVQQVLVAAAIVIGGLLAFLIGRGIARPIRRVTAVLIELAQGHTDVDVPYTERHDEVGDNARAAQTFKDNLLRIGRMESEQRAAAESAAREQRAAVHRIADQFETAVGGIIATVSSAATELEATATTLTRTADQTQHMSATVSAASEEASINVQAVAAATDEMTSSIGEISRQVQVSGRIAEAAVTQAAKTDVLVGQLSIAAQRIGDVVRLITDVAEQTNLLALNVLASEVKALAGQTAKATGEISAQIAAMQAATQDSVTAIKEISGTIGQIAEVASAVAAAVEQQGAATAEISRNIQQAASGTSEVARTIVAVSRGAEETGAASGEVLNAAGQLAIESNQLRSEVAKFLDTVRAA
ncbi:methyl-accepting chemotaxis protein [Rhodoplanes sp. SY1]|uniref:methyl-accepting chemotaxis protein n=1 Tax=Rhodoplanes sp. SY1 TaxID=3166646 RepID=UPI0038B697FB